jgi:hypothetical protein
VGVAFVIAIIWIVAADANQFLGYTYPKTASTTYLVEQAIGSTWMWGKGLVGTVGLVSNNSLIDVGASVPTFTLAICCVLKTGPALRVKVPSG